MPKISVIVPIYKVEKYLRECVESILAQTFKDFELILVDDGSPDGCGAICDEYRSRDERVVVIHKQNGGVSAARRDGVEKATGDWVIFGDPDDLFPKDALESLLKFATDDVDLVEGQGNDFFDFDGNGIPPELDSDINCELVYEASAREYAEGVCSTFQSRKGLKIKEWVPGPWMKIIRAVLLKGTGALDVSPYFRRHEDQIMCLRIGGQENFRKAVKINKVVYTVRHRPESACTGTVVAESYWLKWMAQIESALNFYGEAKKDSLWAKKVLADAAFSRISLFVVEQMPLTCSVWAKLLKPSLPTIVVKFVWVILTLRAFWAIRLIYGLFTLLTKHYWPRKIHSSKILV